VRAIRRPGAVESYACQEKWKQRLSREENSASGTSMRSARANEAGVERVSFLASVIILLGPLCRVICRGGTSQDYPLKLSSLVSGDNRPNIGRPHSVQWTTDYSYRVSLNPLSPARWEYR
jgi:hypothetical protein